MRFVPTLFLLRALLLLPALLGACALSHEADPDDPDPDDPALACVEPDTVRTELRLDAVDSATFVGSTLHLHATIDGRPRYGLFEIAGEDLRLLSWSDLPGPASWLPVSDTRAVRVLDGEPSMVVEVLDVSDADAPRIVNRLELLGRPPAGWPRFFGATSERLYVCEGPEVPGGWHPGTLHVVSLPDLEMVAQTESRPCGRERGRLDGDLVMSWTTDGDAWVDRLDDRGSRPVVDYLYNPDGIHQYGSVLHAATDGSVAVMDPESPREFFVFDLGPEPRFAHAYFAHSSKLLAVVGARAYFASYAGFRSHHLDPSGWISHEWQSPPVTDWRAYGALPLGAVELLAGGDTHLVITGGDSVLYVLDTTVTAPLTEATLFQSDGSTGSGC
jgi:hypothetical protein